MCHCTTGLFPTGPKACKTVPTTSPLWLIWDVPGHTHRAAPVSGPAPRWTASAGLGTPGDRRGQAEGQAEGLSHPTAAHSHRARHILPSLPGRELREASQLRGSGWRSALPALPPPCPSPEQESQGVPCWLRAQHPGQHHCSASLLTPIPTLFQALAALHQPRNPSTRLRLTEDSARGVCQGRGVMVTGCRVSCLPSGCPP